MGDFHQRHLIFNQLDRPGRVHVYRADCRAGERLRVQMLTPILPSGGSVTPAMAVIAQSLPYDGEESKLPFALPAGYSAVVTAPPRALLAPVRDLLTRVSYYPGPVIDTRTLVGGRCYIAVWSPQNQMGKVCAPCWAIVGPGHGVIGWGFQAIGGRFAAGLAIAAGGLWGVGRAAAANFGGAFCQHWAAAL